MSLCRAVFHILLKSGLGKISGLSNFYRFMYKRIQPVEGVMLVSIQGNKMYVDCRDRYGIVPHLMVGGYEKYETELFEELIKPGMVVVDIGANIGYYALLAAKLAGEKGKVYAFEPEPGNYGFLVANIGVNDYKNIIPVHKAVSNRLDTARLFLDSTNLGNPSFSQNNVPKEESFVEVETITLDEFFDQQVGDRHIDLMKIDTQGAEGFIIEGAERVLRRDKVKIVMEFWPYGLRNTGTDPLRLFQRLQEYDFQLKLIIDEINQCIIKQPIELTKVIEMCDGELDGKGWVTLFLEKLKT